MSLIDPDKLCSQIETAYETCGNTQGWRFLYSPAAVLNQAKVAIIGLNPGGDEEVEGHGKFAMETGKSAYVDETWTKRPGEAPLQRQIQALCKRLDVEPHEALTGNLVPWRSKDWTSLNGSKDAVDFGIRLWTYILNELNVEIVVGNGGGTQQPLMTIMGISKMTTIETGWGKVTASYGSNGKQRLICLPHLSTYKIMRNPKYEGVRITLFGQSTESI